MKVILLASGKSLRMQPIKDKNFLSLCGATLLEHQIAALTKAGLRDVIVVAGNHNIKQIQKLKLKSKITVVEQKGLGMNRGVLAAEKKFKKGDEVLVVSANDVVDYSVYRNVMQESLKGDGIIVCRKVKSYFPGGYLIVKNGIVKRIVEKPKPGTEPSALINLVIHRFKDAHALFAHLKKARSVADDQYEVALQNWFSNNGKFTVLRCDGFWQPVKYPWHVFGLMKYFMVGNKHGRHVSIAKSAKITGDVVMEDGVKILDNAVIQGPAYIGKNTVIGNNVLIRGSHIGADCVIGFGSEVARSYIGNNVWLHNNYIGDSVVGNDAAFGAGAITGNYRLDAQDISMNIQGSKVSSGQNKLGIVTGDHIRVGINTSFMPGITIGSNSFIGAGIVVGQDVPEEAYVRAEWQLKISKNKITK